MHEQGYWLSWGEWPGAKIVEHVTSEPFIQEWDLVRATGQSIDLVTDMAESSLANWRAWFGDRPRQAGGLLGLLGLTTKAPGSTERQSSTSEDGTNDGTHLKSDPLWR